MSVSLNISAQSPQSAAPFAIQDLTKSREDYDNVSKVLTFLSNKSRENPNIDELCDHLGLNTSELQNLFTRWAGLSAKEFLQAITLEHARNMLQGSAGLLEITDVLGLSGPARLHDLLVSHEAITPNEFKKLGNGLIIKYGFHDCPFGIALVMTTEQGVCGLGFCDDASGQDALLQDMKDRWPQVSYIHAQTETEEAVKNIFASQDGQMEQTIRIVFIGSDFEIKIWETLLKVPAGRAVTYSDLAEHIGSPGAHRAVGSAVGRNPISLVVPCHRVLRKDASLGGYHWGLTRKQAMIGWEAGKLKAELEE